MREKEKERKTDAIMNYIRFLYHRELLLLSLSDLDNLHRRVPILSSRHDVIGRREEGEEIVYSHAIFYLLKFKDDPGMRCHFNPLQTPSITKV